MEKITITTELRDEIISKLNEQGDEVAIILAAELQSAPGHPEAPPIRK